MPNRVNRASQFMPFDALSGFREALRQVERKVELKKELSIDQEENLNRQIKLIEIGSLIEVVFYSKNEYLKIIGEVKKIDFINKWLIVSNVKIPITEVVSVKILEKNVKI